MTFEIDLFISYTHIDNRPVTQSACGWVTRFHESLDALLSMRIGSKAVIWRDEKLRGNDDFSEEILSRFPKTAVLLSVLSPRYFQSDWCRREVKEFCEAAEKSGGFMLENQARAIKVIKVPTGSQEPVPAFMQKMLGYEFFTLDDGRPLELDPAYGQDIEQQFCRKVAKLAFDIAELLKKLHASNGNGKQMVHSIASKPAVYLAECGYDRRDQREALEVELRQHGYRILPDHTLPDDEAEYKAEVAKLLKECSLSVHLIGSGSGVVKDGPSAKSALVLQNELAIQESAQGKLKRAIWLPEGTTTTHSDHSRFIEALHRDADVQAGADLITGDFETFKTSVHAALDRLQSHKPAAASVPASGKLVYLICTQQDREASAPLRKLLLHRGLEVKIPLFEGPARSVRQANDELLKTADAVLLFYGSGDEGWRRMIESDLKRAGASRATPLPAPFTFVADPTSVDKREMIDFEQPNIINGLAGFAEAQMADFLRSMNCWSEGAQAG